MSTHSSRIPSVSRENLPGCRHGKLVAVQAIDKFTWLCRCDCGREKSIEYSNFFVTKSCGRCNSPPNKGERKYGFDTATERTGTYRTWLSFRRRVNTKRLSHAAYYAHVDMDPRWAEFSAFLADMGDRPDGKSIDRIDNAKGYWPSNCRWATPTEQTRNRSCAKVFTLSGETLPFAEWAKRAGISIGAVAYRLNKYGSLELPQK